MDSQSQTATIGMIAETIRHELAKGIVLDKPLYNIKGKSHMVSHIQSRLVEILLTNVKHLSAHPRSYGCTTEVEARILYGEHIQDKFDILLTSTEAHDVHVAVELDSTRADQIAKKMLSRFAFLCKYNFVYVVFCYPGTQNMNINECEKYIGFGRELLKVISKGSGRAAEIIFCRITGETPTADGKYLMHTIVE